ncbi:MAG: polysaccharide biosynthesis/export family protein [Pseudomonadota bacterium]
MELRPRPYWAAAAAVLALLLAGCASTLRTGMPGPGQAGSAASGPAAELITDQLIAAEQLQRTRRVTDDLSALVVKKPSPYQIGPGDIVAIVVWDHPELASPGAGAPVPGADPGIAGAAPAGFVVDHDGHVQFPYAGVLRLEGLTEEQARSLLAKRLARYFANPNVTLRVQAYRSKRIYVDGEVKAPGLQAINDIPMTLTEALSRAGGLLPSADQSRIALERGPRRYAIDLRELVQKGINPSHLLLAHGDLIQVHSRDESKVFVSGEVVAPKSLTMHNGRLTLNEALGESGGISPTTGDARQVYIVRKKEDGIHVYQLDARDTSALAMAEAFELAPKDLVYVAASPMANWHRGISLLFPSALTSAVGVVRP